MSSLKEIGNFIGDKEHSYIRFDPLECNTSFLKEAYSQLLKKIDLCSMSLEDPQYNKDSSLLLMILQGAHFHSYTPIDK